MTGKQYLYDQFINKYVSGFGNSYLYNHTACGFCPKLLLFYFFSSHWIFLKCEQKPVSCCWKCSWINVIQHRCTTWEILHRPDGDFYTTLPLNNRRPQLLHKCLISPGIFEKSHGVIMWSGHGRSLANFCDCSSGLLFNTDAPQKQN